MRLRGSRLALVACALCAAALFAIPARTAEQPLPIITREAIGKSPFAFTLPDRHGNPKRVAFTDLVFTQNVVMFLWTTQCPLCKLEVRHMNALDKWAKEHPKANLRVVSVNFDDGGLDGFKAAAWDEVMLPKFEILWDPGARHFKNEVWQLDKQGVPITFFFAQGGFPVRVATGFSADLGKIAEDEFLPPERAKNNGK
jgi:thiol-disulfide isomerase/thioredoxin